ncbi:family 8 carbohydrate esterase [Melampsora americana]|nr:family 8 carbohydrate esterase [Melampsora americana]
MLCFSVHISFLFLLSSTFYSYVHSQADPSESLQSLKESSLVSDPTLQTRRDPKSQASHNPDFPVANLSDFTGSNAPDVPSSNITELQASSNLTGTTITLNLTGTHTANITKIKLTPLILPPEASVLPKNSQAKILKPSLENHNLQHTVNATKPSDTTKPPSGAHVVRKGPRAGEFGTIQGALSFLKNLTVEARNVTQTIFIYPGTYNEKLIVDYKGPLKIMGFTADRHNFGRNVVNINGSMGAKQAGSNELSATVRIIKNDFSMYNINVYNSYGHQGHLSQAIALSGTGSRQAYYACSFFGYQDTLLTLNGYHYYSECYIQGAIDFIFTQKAVVWFEKATIGSIAAGVISANGRNDAINPSRYVFNRAKVISKGAAAGSVYLARPWGNYSRTTFQFSYLSEVVNPLAWRVWQEDDTRTNHATYTEYRNHGPGSVLFPPNWNYTLTHSQVPIDVGKPANGSKPSVPTPPIVENGTRLGVPPGSRAVFGKERPNPCKVTSVLGKDYTLWIDPDFGVEPFSSGTAENLALGGNPSSDGTTVNLGGKGASNGTSGNTGGKLP